MGSVPIDSSYYLGYLLSPEDYLGLLLLTGLLLLLWIPVVYAYKRRQLIHRGVKYAFDGAGEIWRRRNEATAAILLLLVTLSLAFYVFYVPSTTEVHLEYEELYEGQTEEVHTAVIVETESGWRYGDSDEVDEEPVETMLEELHAPEDDYDRQERINQLRQIKEEIEGIRDQIRTVESTLEENPDNDTLIRRSERLEERKQKLEEEMYHLIQCPLLDHSSYRMEIVVREPDLSSVRASTDTRCISDAVWQIEHQSFLGDPGEQMTTESSTLGSSVRRLIRR